MDHLNTIPSRLSMFFFLFSFLSFHPYTFSLSFLLPSNPGTGFLHDLKKLKHGRDLSRFYRVKGPSQAFLIEEQWGGGLCRYKSVWKKLNNGRGCPIPLAVYRFYRPDLHFNFRSSIRSNPCYRTIVSISFERIPFIGRKTSNWLSILSIQREYNMR